MEPFLYFLLIGDAAMFGLCSSVVVHLRYKRHEAFQGDASAARKLILPAFEPLLWVMAILSGLTFWTFVILLAGHIPFTSVPQWVSYFFDSSGRFVLLIIPVLMLQKSISFPAPKCTTLLFSTYLIPVVWASRKLKTDSMLTPGMQDVVSYIGLALRLAILPIYVYVIVNPPARASKRTLRGYCVYVGIYHGLRIMGNHLAEDRIRHKSQYELIYVTTAWGMFVPFVVWRVLKADTEHWRGLGGNACALQRSKSMSGTSMTERISSEGLHVLIEMHRRHIVDFASLEVKHKIGTGASSVVYQGVLRSKTLVAVKVYTPKEFADDVIASFSHEAALCSSLYHPNIVKFYGMCVCPPTICLVSELCQGSLDHVTMAMAETVSRNASPSAHKCEHVLINLGFMLGAARSVAHLNSFTPALVHRDIKPSNFLVDFENNVKLTDFGESRCLPQFAAASTIPVAALDASSAAVGEPNSASINADSKQSFSMSSQTRCSSHSIRSSDRQQLA
ncbi:Tkl protein kinase, partial [Globisporangium splendens]